MFFYLILPKCSHQFRSSYLFWNSYSSNGSKWQWIYGYFHQRFSAKFGAKITAEISVGTEVCKLMDEERYGESLSSSEKEAWYQFWLVVKIYLGNKSHRRSQNFLIGESPKPQITCNNVIINFWRWNFLWVKDIVEWKIRSSGLVWHCTRILLKRESLRVKEWKCLNWETCWVY